MGIHSIPRTYPEILHWSQTYESKTMIPTTPSHQLAEITTSLLIYYQPSCLKPLAKKLIIGLMDERLREAMMYPRQERWVYWVIEGFFGIRRVWLRNFALPRWRGVYYTSDKENEFGRYNVNYADNEVSLPWKDSLPTENLPFHYIPFQAFPPFPSLPLEPHNFKLHLFHLSKSPLHSAI